MNACLWYRILLIALLQEFIECKHSSFALHQHDTSNLNGNYAFVTFQNISSLQQCAKKCHFADDCNAFVFHADQSVCQFVQNGSYPYTKLKSVFASTPPETEFNSVSVSTQTYTESNSVYVSTQPNAELNNVSVSPSPLCHSMSSTTPSGVYNITLESGNVMSAYCDMDTLGGRWTVIQKRYDGSLNFYKTWEEYKQGFGDLNFEFWLGNENMHLLTSSGNHELRIEMEDVDGNAFYASYNSFSVRGESSKYLLRVSGFSGNVFIDQMLFNDYTSFSTRDSDNDDYYSQDCAEILQGGWWYASCGTTNLNGAYNPSHSSNQSAMHWRELTATSPYYTTLRACKMMTRPVT